jgi:5'-nucleotidase
VIISSSGVGIDGIKFFLQRNNVLYDNIYIISNQLTWDKNGYMIDYKEPIIHSKNKDETTLKEFDFYPKIKDRKNVILLGDDPEDVNMITGFDYDNIIKIGFLNYNIEQCMASFKKNYDVILLNDQSMDHINKLIRSIIQNS